MTELNPTLTLWRAVQPRVDRAIRNAADGRDGYPTGSTGGSSGSSDRTGTLALRHVHGGGCRQCDDEGCEHCPPPKPHDPNGGLHRELERTIAKLANLVDALAPNNAATEHLRASTPESERRPDECESCWRDGGYRAKTRREGGRLCRWCEDVARDLNVDVPPLMLVELRHQGKRITDRDVRIATQAKGRR